MALLNTNTRYLHESVVAYAERLAATLPAPLEVCFFVCSGSEATELALRMARTFTNRRDVIVLESGYHGNTSAAIEVSAYKFNGPGGTGAPAHVHTVPTPDAYRHPERQDPAQVAAAIRGIAERCDSLPAAFLAETISGCGGQIVPPPGFLQHAYQAARLAGAVCIADEVQTGFGRVGSHFWAFETQHVVPDIVTLGKPIGNGHPLAAVITTREIADAFANGMEYFNTYGGNPVSSAIGMAVLDVIEDEQLQQHAQAVGTQLLHCLRQLAGEHEWIGDVRGCGLFCGIEFVRNRDSRAPAHTVAAHVVERMRQQRILASTDGPLNNVVKFKPPMTFGTADAERYCNTLGTILQDSALAEIADRS